MYDIPANLVPLRVEVSEKYKRVPMVCLIISILCNSNLHIVSFVII